MLIGTTCTFKTIIFSLTPCKHIKVIIDNIYLGLHSQNESITYSADGSCVIFENSVK